MLGRRDALSAAARVAALAGLAALGACKRREGERCARCGMRIEPGSPFAAELHRVDGAVARYDSPRCALLDLVKDRAAVRELRVQDYYGRAWHPGAEVRFVRGSDVEGPMGPEMVPVLPDQLARFQHDHPGDRTFTLDAIDAKALDE